MSDLLERTLGLAPDTRERLLWTIGVVFSAPTTNHTAGFGRDSGVAITARMLIPCGIGEASTTRSGGAF